MVIPDGPVDRDRDPDEPDRRRPVRRASGSVLGAAMMGLHQALYGPPKETTVIEIETSGDPPNLDTDGLDADFGPDHRMIGPPLDAIKSRARRTRKVRRR